MTETKLEIEVRELKRRMDIMEVKLRQTLEINESLQVVVKNLMENMKHER